MPKDNGAAVLLSNPEISFFEIRLTGLCHKYEEIYKQYRDDYPKLITQGNSSISEEQKTELDNLINNIHSKSEQIFNKLNDLLYSLDEISSNSRPSSSYSFTGSIDSDMGISQYTDPLVTEPIIRIADYEFLWKIPHYKMRLKQSKDTLDSERKVGFINSEAAYCTYSSICPKVRFRLVPFSSLSKTKNEFASVHYHFMPGKWDDLIDFPFKHSVEFEILKSWPVSKPIDFRVRNDLCLIKPPDDHQITKRTFQKNPEAFGQRLASLSYIEKRLIHDTLFIHITIKPK